MNDEENALKYFSKSYEIKKNLGFTRGISKLICNIAQLYYMKNEFEKSVQYLDTALLYAKETNSPENIYKIYYYFSVLYNDAKEFELALKYHKLFTAKKDSLFTIESSKKIADMQVKYDTQKKEKENELLRKESQIQKHYRNFLILSTLLILIIAIITFNRYLLKKRTNKLLSEKKQELEILIATKDKFFSIIAHDLKNPFGTLLSVSELLANNYSELSDEHKIKIINTINNSANLTHNLLENLLHWSISQRGTMPFNPSEISINEVISDTCSLLQLNLEKKNLTLSKHLTKTHISFADRNMIATVFRNILSNAIKFTPDNGNISIFIKENNEFNLISIEDTGIGMSQQDLQKLFKIEVKNSSIGKSKEKGTGLGLILCKEFITKNNGKIQVESQPNVGSKFTVSIPKSRKS
jgi:signal transduction histidine kinase